jgi:hypothetical protein
MTDPTNAQLLKAIEAQGQAFKDHADEDHRFQEHQGKVNNEFLLFKAETEGKLSKLDDIPTREELPDLIEKAMASALKSKGKTFYAGFLILVGIVGGLVVIGGGAKALLGWIGFSYLK